MNLENLKKAAEKIKDKVLYKTPLDKMLNEVTSDENWTGNTKVLGEVAEHTFNYNDFNAIMKHIWERLSQKGKKWRRILKTLNLMEYLTKNGSPRCVGEFKDEIYQLRTLQDFSLYEQTLDRGASIREKVKELIDLITDDQKLETERENAKKIREKMQAVGGSKSLSSDDPFGYTGGSSSNSKYEGYGSSIAKKYEGYGGDAKYYDSNNKDSYDRYDRYDKYDNNNASKFRSDNDVKEKPKEEYVIKENSKYSSNNNNNEPKPEPKIESPDPKPELKNFKLPKPGEKKEDAPKPLPTPAQTQNIAAIQKPPTNTSLIDMEETVQSISKPQNNLWNTPFQQQPPPQEQQSPANVNIWQFNVAPQQNNQNPQTNWNWNQQANPQGQNVQPQLQPIVQQNQPSVVPGNRPNPQYDLSSLNMNVNNSQTQPQLQQSQTTLTNSANLQLDLNNSAKKANMLVNPSNDEFDNFQTANTDNKKQPANAYKSFNDVETNLINLSDLSKDDKVKKTSEKPAIQSKSEFNDPSMLLTTQFDLETFSLSMNKGPAPGPINTRPLGNMYGSGMNQHPMYNGMGGMGNMGQMGYMGQMGPMSPLGPMGQMGPMGMGGQMGNGQMGMGQMGMGQMGMGQMGMGQMGMGQMGMGQMGVGQMGMGQMGVGQMGMGPMGMMGQSNLGMGMGMNTGLGYGKK